MSEFSKVTGDSGRSSKDVVGTTEEKTGRRWVRRALWGIAIIVAGLLISGTIAAILWCN